MKIKEIIREIERRAPVALQEGFDNCGVQVGDVDAEAIGALICLDVSEAVVDEALAHGCNLIISHHPLAFKPFKSLTGRNDTERCMMKACRHELVIYAAHTNLDNALGGLNFVLARRIGLQSVRILSPKEGALLKLAVFVPNAHAEAVRKAIFEAGAGQIGMYDSCSFAVGGEGSFRAGEDCRPFCGEVGLLHKEPEMRIETIMPAYLKPSVVRALLNAHPYEEPAFDLYPLANSWAGAGSGIIGELPKEEDAREFLLRIKGLFGSESLKHSAILKPMLKRIAVCGGSGSFLIPEAASAGADILITGEAKYNDYYDASDRGLLLAVAGHYETEWGAATEALSEIISKKFPTFAQHISNVNFNPIKYL
ncbi:MAG: Nif3-like dinuclear metal center hexameric protein [Tannerellaceae bacterium]|jgi:dinuclear metal center YbgI/SA1388 family protein|nr:Nif3-like dinuclear metal center hexameric protein [Tannerellaceae bacterium]